MRRLSAVVALLLAAAADGLVVATAPSKLAYARRHVAIRAQFDSQQEASASFDSTAQQFDLLSLRSFRRDTILQYDATNQSEPLRIALCFFGILFSLSVPSLAQELRISDSLTADVGAAIGATTSAALFARNRGARLNRMEKIDREYAMGDLSAIYRGVRRTALRELRGKRRVVVLYGTRSVVDSALLEARAYRRRLAAANAVVVPLYTDGAASAPAPVSEATSVWLWAAADPAAWLKYFDELLSARAMSDRGGGAWVGLNLRGRTFGSALGQPTWDEILGTALQPQGDGFGELKEAEEASLEATGAEAAAAAAELEAGGNGATAEEHVALLRAQSAFYDTLTSGDASAMAAVWTEDGRALDGSVTEAVASGARIEPWEAGSNAFPPAGMRATDRDALILPDGTGWTTAVERPREGGTLLATQRWRRAASGGEWRLESHRYIPWSADGATAILSLRCDQRGCVLLGRQINTPAA